MVLQIITFSSCRKKMVIDPCESVSCQKNAFCNDGKCECEGNSYKVRGSCITKDANTFYFAGKGCYCIPDTFTLQIVKDATNPQVATVAYVAPWLNTTAGAITNGSYYTMPSGDSIRVLGVFDGLKGCDIKGKSCTAELLGKYKGTTGQLD